MPLSCTQSPRITQSSVTASRWYRHLLATPQQTSAHRPGTHAKTLLSPTRPSPLAATLQTSSPTATKEPLTFVELSAAVPLTRTPVSMVVSQSALMAQNLFLRQKVLFFLTSLSLEKGLYVSLCKIMKCQVYITTQPEISYLLYWVYYAFLIHTLNGSSLSQGSKSNALVF